MKLDTSKYTFNSAPLILRGCEPNLHSKSFKVLSNQNSVYIVNIFGGKTCNQSDYESNKFHFNKDIGSIQLPK